MLAEAHGIQGLRVSAGDRIRSAVSGAETTSGPIHLDIKVGREITRAG
jgi:thiamine pyrophosphate-dependent acetolactate synthase large subunit-like protein